MIKRMAVTAAVVLGVLGQCGKGGAGTIVGWTVRNTPGSLAATLAAPGVSGIDLSRGPGISYHSPDPDTKYNSKYFTTDNRRNESDYLQWGFTSASPWDLTGVAVRAWSDTYLGRHRCAVLASFDGGDFVEVIPPPGVIFTEMTLEGDLSAYTGVRSAVFRLYAWSAEVSHGAFALMNAPWWPEGEQAIRVTGIPEPGTLWLLALGGLSLIHRRHKA